MRYTIENEFIRLTVDSLGAEMVSAYARFNCTVRYDAASDEYIVVVLYG